MKIDELMASVVLLGEASPPTQVDHYLTQIINEQTHKNLDFLVITVPRLDLEEIQDKWNKSEWNVRWLEANPGVDMISMGAESAVGDVIFYKTCGPVIWYPDHILAHLEEFSRNRQAKWALSHLEKRNLKDPQGALNLLGWRTDNPPKIEEVIIDEICHQYDLKPNWEPIMIEQDDKQAIVPGMVLKQWTDDKIPGCMPSEITVVQWIDPAGAQTISVPVRSPKEIREEILEDEKDGELNVKHFFSPILGNSQLNGYNELVWEAIGDYTPERIAIKRTIGMGDVIQAEPVIRALKEKYNNAHVTFFTSKTRSCSELANYFEGVDEIIEIDETQLLQDVLGTGSAEEEEVVEKDGELVVEKTKKWEDNFELKFDLDLAYESRPGVTFPAGYCQTVKLKEEEVDKPKLTFSSDKPNVTGNYVVLCNEGSGWQGKEWDKEGWTRLGKVVQKLGYQIVETALNKDYHLFENSIKTDGSLDQFLQYCQHASAYIGADNGVMHACATFDVPCFVVAGAALPSMTYPKGDIYEVKADNEFVGCKHKFFYRTDGPMFVPANQERCFEGLTVEGVEEEFQKFIKTKKL